MYMFDYPEEGRRKLDQSQKTYYIAIWKVCIVQPRSRLRSFKVPYIFYSKFSKSRERSLQTFQSGLYLENKHFTNVKFIKK